MKTLFCALFLLAALIQLAVPLHMAREAEATLRHGTPVKFRLQLRDPYDPFRGKYVRLRFEWGEPQVAGEVASGAPRKLLVCAHVEVDPDGFGAVTAISIEPPAEGLWFRVSARKVNGTYWLEPQFDRYFVNEREAAVAEKLYFETVRASADDGETRSLSYAIVRLRKGSAQLEEVMLKERSLAEAARESLRESRE